ncbi:hypothetical protein BJX63DRAFT_417094 [Aspergillus granulosus]|uniref:Uncharacterized protein n=1 Tax=Aspergillus granulosus TaxID=176169 RepID=A0ABR4GRD9_9EURO
MQSGNILSRPSKSFALGSPRFKSKSSFFSRSRAESKSRNSFLIVALVTLYLAKLKRSKSWRNLKKKNRNKRKRRRQGGLGWLLHQVERTLFNLS